MHVFADEILTLILCIFFGTGAILHLAGVLLIVVKIAELERKQRYQNERAKDWSKRDS